MSLVEGQREIEIENAVHSFLSCARKLSNDNLGAVMDGLRKKRDESDNPEAYRLLTWAISLCQDRLVNFPYLVQVNSQGGSDGKA